MTRCESKGYSPHGPLRAWGSRYDKQTTKLPAPWAQALENIPGAEHNLLHKLQLRADLRVEFELWSFSEPSPSAPDYLDLFIDRRAEPVARRHWIGPVTPDQLFILLPQEHLTAGVHSLVYRVMSGLSGETAESEVFEFTVVSGAPELGGDRGQLRCPDDLGEHLTAPYLAAHGDQLEVIAPAHYPLRAGDLLTWYWEHQPVGSLEMGHWALTADDLTRPLRVILPGEAIRERGDGLRYLTCDVTHRAGFVTGLSKPVALQVEVTPVPRQWPAPTVHDAFGAQFFGNINPLFALGGATVRIPATATFYSGERVLVQWGEAGMPGAARVVVSITGEGPWIASVGKHFIAAHMGKLLTVNYRLLGGTDDSPVSHSLAIAVGVVPQERFPTVQSRAGTVGSGRLSVSGVPPSGDPLHLAPWLFIAAGQKVRLSAQGTLHNGASELLSIVDGAEVSPPQASSGIGASLSSAWLAGLRLNTPLTLRVAVSFDGGECWFDFPDLPLVLVA
jgi:hypothetical protein